MMHVHELSSTLPHIIRDLGVSLNRSGLELTRLRQHFLERDNVLASTPSHKTAELLDMYYRRVERERWKGWMKVSLALSAAMPLSSR